MTDYPPPPNRPTPGSEPPPSYGSYPTAPGQQYGQQPYGAYPQGSGQGYAPQRRNGLGLASMILGIVGVVGTIIYIGVIASILAVIFGLIGRGRAKRQEASNGGQALAGLILGLIGIVAFVIYVVVVVSFVHRHCHRNLDGQLVCTRYGT